MHHYSTESTHGPQTYENFDGVILSTDNIWAEISVSMFPWTEVCKLCLQQACSVSVDLQP